MQDIRVPRLGWSMEEGTFVGWLKKSGDTVAVGEGLFELEGEKATQEIESVDAGVLHIPTDAPQPGALVSVGALLAYLLAPGETPPGATEKVTPAQTLPAASKGDTVASPTTAKDTQIASPSQGSLPAVSPRAKRIARELGVDWTVLSGTGRDGRVREVDVRSARPSLVPPPGKTPASNADCAPVKLSARRRAIADKLRQSRDRAIPVTLTTIFDATNLVSLRDQFKATGGHDVPAYTDFVACVVASVLKRHSHLAMRWDHDQTSLITAGKDRFDLGIAVHTEEGLLVPVVRDVGKKSVVELARESRALIERARAGKLTSAEMQGGHFTITSLGAMGIDGFTPMLNYPEIAILGLGAIRRVPTVLPDDRVVPREQSVLSLTFDHAAVDGAPAAAFLKDLSITLTNPAPVLLGANQGGTH